MLTFIFILLKFFLLSPYFAYILFYILSSFKMDHFAKWLCLLKSIADIPQEWNFSQSFKIGIVFVV